MQAPQWLAAYLYYHEPWEPLLGEAVEPFVNQILTEGLASHFFYIRYWERGPHIRLRFKGDPRVLADQVKPKLNDWFENYYEQKPSERPEFEWLADLPEDQRWYQF